MCILYNKTHILHSMHIFHVFHILHIVHVDYFMPFSKYLQKALVVRFPYANSLGNIMETEKNHRLQHAPNDMFYEDDWFVLDMRLGERVQADS
jgi:hypothetical protein